MSKKSNEKFPGFEADPTFGMNAQVKSAACSGCAFYQVSGFDESCKHFGSGSFFLQKNNGYEKCPMRKESKGGGEVNNK